MLRPVTVTGLSADDYNRFKAAAKGRGEVRAAREVFLAGLNALDAPAPASSHPDEELRKQIADLEVYSSGLQRELSDTIGRLSVLEKQLAEAERPAVFVAGETGMITPVISVDTNAPAPKKKRAKRAKKKA